MCVEQRELVVMESDEGGSEEGADEIFCLGGTPELRKENSIAKAARFWKGVRVPISAAFGVILCITAVPARITCGVSASTAGRVSVVLCDKKDTRRGGEPLQGTSNGRRGSSRAS